MKPQNKYNQYGMDVASDQGTISYPSSHSRRKVAGGCASSLSLSLGLSLLSFSWRLIHDIEGQLVFYGVLIVLGGTSN